ncbi:hypothetical protein [Phnomibacter ginsenosidimutans]|uniref:Sensor of ECF-type sigma factor n=1 Tax=Phnomibacter ginsenosidimutans TaxID=2676868 RepID=A0A6I6G997_9BACT|nr:hypothetical protein [Phnomibacter ginsenosidimutans]QGW28934.1 hypothetical protein GLV81_13235 [Phnomibacter ginsenosidimutans]
MKKFLFSVLVLALGSTVNAQTVKDELAYVQQIWGKEKKAVVSEALQLKTEDAEKFWPLYEAYQTTRNKLGQDRMAAIENYSNNFETMTDAKATEIAKAVLAYNKALNKLQGDYLKKISKAVSPIKAVQFLQLENYIDAQIKAVVSEALPFFPDKK